MGKTISYLQPAQLRKSRGCETYRAISLMHLTKEPVAEEERKKELTKVLKNALACGTEEEAVSMWSRFFDSGYLKLPGVIAKEQGQQQEAMGTRLIRWFYKEGCRVLAQNSAYSFLYEPGLAVSHTSDLLVEREGKKAFFDLSWGSNPYSDKARKAESLTANSVELLCRMAANCAGEGAGILYLKSKDDTAKGLAEEFEAKPGKNVAFLPYTEDARTMLASAMKLPERMDCAECSKRNLCSARPCVIERTGKKGKEASLSDIRLTPTQEEVVAHRDGPLCVVAVPGSGKTTALTVRLTKLIQGGVDPRRICMITFTNKACAEIADRVARYVKGVQPDIFTFHGLAHAGILEAEGETGEISHLETTTKRLKLIETALERCPVIKGCSYDYREGDFGLLGHLSTLFKNIEADGGSGIRPGEDREGILRVYREYRKLYEKGNYFDFDYLIRRFKELLGDERTLKHFQDKYDYIMVDEVQDVDGDQWDIVRMLAGKKENLVIVGDDDQNLYKWRGASSKYMLNFPMYYKKGRVLYMEDNFRSSGNINAAANTVIDGNDERYGKEIRTRNPKAGYPVFYGENYDLASLTDLIRRLSFARSDICVLARTNAALEKLKVCLEREDIKCLGPRNYLTDSGVFGLLYGLVSLYVKGGETCEETIYRFLKLLGTEPVKSERGLYADYIASRRDPRIEDAFDALETSKTVEDALVDSFKALTGSSCLSPEFDALLKKTAEEEAGTVEELYSSFSDMVKYGDDTEIEYGPKEGYINLLTAHKAKGKEFPCVIVSGTEDFEDSEEDRRLLYVAISRGKMLDILINLGLKKAELVEEIKDRPFMRDLQEVKIA